MALFVGIVLALVSVVVLALPILWQRRGTLTPASAPDPLQDVRWQQQQVFDDIKSLILEYELGNVLPEEYEERLGTYRLRAADLLRQQDQLSRRVSTRKRDMKQDIEDRVLALRRSWGSVKRVTVCAGCRGDMDINARICPRCELPREGEASPRGDAPGRRKS